MLRIGAGQHQKSISVCQSPTGQGITFGAEARQVPTIKYDKVQRLSLSDSALHEGKLLGSGHDKKPYNVLYKSQVNAEVEI
jgi:hypothetical protein